MQACWLAMRLRQIVGQGKHAMEFILFTLVTFHFDSLISFRLMLDDICLTSSTSLTLFLN